MSQMNSHKTVEGIARNGIDLAKSVFHLVGMDSNGRLLLLRRLARSGLLKFLKLIKTCLAGMEACAGSDHLDGKVQNMGFDVRSMALQHLKPYVKSNKNEQRTQKPSVKRSEGLPYALCRWRVPRSWNFNNSTGSGAWPSPEA